MFSISFQTRSWISFIHEKCKDAVENPDFIIKIDDDVSVDLKAVANVLEDFTALKKVVLGRVFTNNPVVRNPDSKW